jgi:hypothetical protein
MNDQGYNQEHRRDFVSLGDQHVADDRVRIVIADLRMGQEPYYGFNFTVASRRHAPR